MIIAVWVWALAGFGAALGGTVMVRIPDRLATGSTVRGGAGSWQAANARQKKVITSQWCFIACHYAESLSAWPAQECVALVSLQCEAWLQGSSRHLMSPLVTWIATI